MSGMCWPIRSIHLTGRARRQDRTKYRCRACLRPSLAVALLIRFHVRRGGFLITQKYEKSVGLRMALAFAKNTSDVTHWSHTEQLNLIQGMKATAAMTELTKAEKAMLKGLPAEKFWNLRDDLANATGSFRDLRRACHDLETWPASKNYQWSYSKAQPRTVAPYALPREACEQPPGPLDPPITPPLLPPVGLAKWHGSFKLDDSGLPPMPS